ncbi:MAG: hypothetical protein CFE23_14815 [Flavobacterium sp. BFFFF1]|uniref:DUF2779 domain-containing protein n=1 Tax=Flavobacterium sp. BFFFF1 TaxID=2015557 RepID=UPI000BCEF7A9|nr:DUF2779 domain-containing protein [Flavobacterium sp. BFFFF1]OYU79257.1 MAG: hypothetical protein CFE23_14815 [Flavobacterium sp. BFFFF1]
MRVLTKSRFKLGLECPNKLFYTGKKEYANKKQEDPFLLALAEGGFQIEEYARMHYPNGVLIEGDDGKYELLWKQTQELLKQENIVIYEAAFLHDGLFIRTDILVKKGDVIKLIEVKSKSFDPNDDYLFVGKRGAMVPAWKPYLFDVAFQKYVMQLCYPDWEISSFIMMANKSARTTINGLNQFFRVSKEAGNRTGVIKTINSLQNAGTSVLEQKNTTAVVTQIINDTIPYSPDLTFTGAVEMLKENYLSDTYSSWPTSYSCKSCEFVNNDAEAVLRSGFKECFEKQHNWGEPEFSKPKTFDVWSFRKGAELFNSGIYFMDELTEDSIGLKPEAGRLSMSERQWIQIRKEVDLDTSIHIDVEGLRQEIDDWNYPLHFIDFETSAVPLPFTSGRRPYEQIAFQFSVHTYYQDGRIEHSAQYLNNAKGVFPNFDFVRALREALDKDNGTIFRYSNHENTILNAIYEQLLTADELDSATLIAFIKSISHSKSDSAEKWIGERDMVDLWDVLKKYYYNPLTKGSNSIKYVLPAILNSCKYLRDKYSQPIDKINLTSQNLPTSHVWLTCNGEVIENPYKKLPRLFEDWSEEELDEVVSGMEELADGGAALTAYGKMQYTDISDAELDELSTALLKYCELDTLAMVMLFEHFKEIAE